MFVPPCFLWASNEGLYPPPPPRPPPLLHCLFFFFFLNSIPVSALRCHKRSYSLWFTLRFLRDGLGTPEKDNACSCSCEETHFYETVGERRGEKLDFCDFSAYFCEKWLFPPIDSFSRSAEWEVNFKRRFMFCVLNSLRSFTSCTIFSFWCTLFTGLLFS